MLWITLDTIVLPLCPVPRKVTVEGPFWIFPTPEGKSLNDHVSKERFDGNLFALKLPSIDTIVEDIIDTNDDPVLFKVDVMRVFRNLLWTQPTPLSLALKWITSTFWISVWLGPWHGFVSINLRCSSLSDEGSG